MMQVQLREVLVNMLAGRTAVRDPLRRVRNGSETVDFEKVVDVALASLQTRRTFFGDPRIQNATILEIGSGLSACLAVLLLAMGARKVVNVEIDRFGFVRDVELYRRLVERASAAGIPIEWPPAGLAQTGEKQVEFDPARLVLHHGVSATLIPEPSASIDLALSLAVLEHVRPGDMEPVARELFRLMRPGAIACHRIDMVDHYTRQTEPFRFLCFGMAAYDWMYSNRGSSSNRFRLDDFERIFKKTGFADVHFDEVHLFQDAARFERWVDGFHADFKSRPRDVLRAMDCLMVTTR